MVWVCRLVLSPVAVLVSAECVVLLVKRPLSPEKTLLVFNFG